MSIFDGICFGVLIIAFIAVGLSKWSKSQSAYLFADRNIGWLGLTATLVMTEFNTATLLSFTSMGYAAGFRALALPMIFFLALLFYAAAAAKKWKAFDGMSVAGFFTARYGSRLGKLTSVLLLTAMLGFSAAYIKSLSLLFLPLSPFTHTWFISGLLITLILLMSLRGGLIAIIRTDVFSFFLVLLFFPLVALYLWKGPNLPALEFTSLPSEEILHFRFLFSLVILTMFTYILAPWYGQKMFAAKSGKIAFRAVVAAALLVFLLYGSAIVATVLMRYRGIEAPSWEQALPMLIDRCLPAGMRGLAYALLFAISATTLTGVWSAMAAMWIGDFSKAASTESRHSIFVTLCFAVSGYLLANLVVDRVFDKLILANIPVAALSFGLLAGFYWKKATLFGVYASILVGCIISISAYFIYGETGCYTWYWAIYGIPLIFLSGILCSIISRWPRTSRSKSKSRSLN